MYIYIYAHAHLHAQVPYSRNEHTIISNGVLFSTDDTYLYP